MANRKSSRRRPRRGGGNGWVYIAGAGVALSLVGVMILLGTVGGDEGDGANAEVVVPTPRTLDAPTQGTIYGNQEAPVTITEYLDFQCPVCLRAESAVIAPVVEKYVLAGQAKLDVKSIAILGDESVAAAAAAECASDQDAFWPYHDILFANQGAENDGGYNDSRLKQFAAAVGLDTADFNSCFDSGIYEDQVESSTDAAAALGVKGTPTIFVDGVRVETSVEGISAAIDRALGGG
jgi:protein-disulfide isomerase